jgi:hypothetical protein
MKSNPLIFIVIAVIVVIVVGAIWFIWNDTKAPRLGTNVTNTTNTETNTSSSSETELPRPGSIITECSGCVGLQDNGKTLDMTVTSRLTIELPNGAYASSSLKLSPPDLMGETFGATARVGNWARTFEAVKAGKVTITVPGNRPSYPSFQITVVIK